MNIRFLGAHNCESQNSKFASLLIDDVLVIDAGALTSSLSLAEQQRIKTILLTHHHYDHIRDIPAIAMNLFLHETAIDVYSIPAVYDALTAYLLNDKIYPNFLERPQGNPTIRFTAMEPYQTRQVEGYSIMAVPVNHSVPTVGFQVTSPDGNTVFYTSDTGPGLADCWRHISPRLIITEVTAPDRYEEFARESGHLTPSLLQQELDCFRKLKGYLPPAFVVHMNPKQEKEIEAEIAAVARSLNSPITLAHEGMLIQL